MPEQRMLDVDCLRVCYWLIEKAALIVPRRERNEWRETWLGELYHYYRSRELERDGPLELKERIEIFRRSIGAFSHALWLCGRQWRIETMWKDLFYGVRQGWKRPGFTTVVVATLALGIGANSYLFSVIDGLIFHPFPYRDVDRLVALGATFPKFSPEERYIESLSIPDFREIEERSETLEKFLAFDMGNRDLGGVSEPERLLTASVLGDPFDTLGMPPVVGRAFTEEEIAKKEPVAIISHRLWQRQFGGDPDTVGKPIVVNGVPRTLVGVMPERLLLLDSDLWLPDWYAGADLPRSRRVLTVLARVKDGASIEEVRAELSTFAGRIAADLVSETPEYEGFHLAATPFVDVWAGFVGPGGPMLLAAVGLVLFIACANIAGLLLARSAARRHEIAVRTAIGASRGRIAQQLLTEAFVLAFLGGALGLILAYWGIRITAANLPADLPLGGIVIGINFDVLAYTFLLCVLSGLFFGLLPAVASSRVDPQSQLAVDGSRSSGPSSSRFSRRAFVALQVALSVVLLSGAGLVLKSLNRLSLVEPGFDPSNVLTMRLTLAWERYEGKMLPFYERLVEDLESLPGVRAAALATRFPPFVLGDQPFEVEGREPETDGALPSARVTVASKDFFDTLGMKLVRGRSWTRDDDSDSPQISVVNETLAARYFPSEEPIGRRIRIGGSGTEAPWATIAGVVSDVRNQGLDRDVAPEIFRPMRQGGQWANQMFVLVRTDTEPLAMLPSVRKTVREIDPDQPIYAIQTLSERLSSATRSRKLVSYALVALAGTAVLLACMGLYGVVAYLVGERQREFGIRMAMGASRRDLLHSVLFASLRLVGVGALLGVLAAFVLTRSLSSILYDVEPGDPTVLAGSALLLLAIGLAASIAPARRAAQVDPVETFR